MIVRLTEIFLLESQKTTFPLVAPDEFRRSEPDGHWWEEILMRMFRSIPASVKTWGPEHESEARMSLSGMITRVRETLTEMGEVRLKDVKKSGMLEFKYLDPDDVVQRGDFRYTSDKLAAVIESGKDLVPIAVGADPSGRYFHVLDGHHRLRAYMIAERQVPAFVGHEDPEGKVGTISFVVDTTRKK